MINGKFLNINIPARFSVATLLFIASLIGYIMRTNFSINIIAMVENSARNTTEPLPDYGPRYNWTQSEQGFLLGAYFYGYMLTTIPGGALAENFGCKRVLGISLLLAGILTALTPLAAMWNLWAVWFLRFTQGFLQGVLYPSCHNLISKWSPPDERSKFIASLQGGTFGTVITWPLSGTIIQTLGWHWSFYIAAIIVFTGTLVWFLFIADTPAKHRWISDKERNYIEQSLHVNQIKKKRLPPYMAIMMSSPFWALMCLHYANMWGLFFWLTATPKFLNEALGFNLSSAGFIGSLPYILRLVGAFLFGSLADLIRRKNWLTVTATRKVFCLSSHILPGCFLILLAYFGKDPMVGVVLMSISLGFNGAATVTNLQNSQDLAPNYAGSLYGIINFVGSTPGFFSPMLVAFFTKDNNSIEGWYWIFLIGASIYILSAILFWLLGSGNVQKWNDFDNEPNTKEKI